MLLEIQLRIWRVHYQAEECVAFVVPYSAVGLFHSDKGQYHSALLTTGKVCYIVGTHLRHL
jgi:hypothetical protein